MTFDEWFDVNCLHLEGHPHRYEDAYDKGHEEGVQSRQAEVDALKKRIGDLEDAISCSLPYIETTPTILTVLKDTLEEGWK